jgi:hypothetical protein
VYEIWANGRRTPWNLHKHDVFIPEAYTADYIAEHLMNRHEHFGLGMEIDGRCYLLGKGD